MKSQIGHMAEASETGQAYKLGTFAGVFTPSILTILGIILFRRVGYVVGTSGLVQTLGVVAFATLISVLSSMSLSAIATNIRVKKGGDYYLISRTLGVEFGGAIGLVLFLAQSVSIAFYCIGFGEALAALSGWGNPHAVQIIAAAAAGALFIPAWFGADVAAKFQFLVMLVLACALGAFFWGAGGSWSGETLADSWFISEGGAGFWFAFAIFFPAVTGFTQGVSMSGDLRDPARSLPLGTFAAVGLSTLVYFGVVVLYAGAKPTAELASNYEVMRDVASVPWLIDAGVIAATLSSAMASFLGAPRILQSLAGDKIFRFLTPFSKGHGPSENPRRGVLLSAGIAMITIALGNLNVIAPVVSMFFLISYGLLNYATYYEARAGSPSFRPRFRWFDQRLSLGGAIACLGAMLAIDVPAAIAGTAIMFGIFQYLKRTAGPARWADSSRAHHFRVIRQNLLAMASEPEHPRDWRPHILALSDDAPRRERLMRFASWIEGKTGLTTAVRFLMGEGPLIRQESANAEDALRAELSEKEFQSFALCVSAPNLLAGARMLLQAYGVGPLRCNTILLNWLEQYPWHRDDEKERQYGAYLRAALRLQRNVVVLEAEDDEWEAVDATPPDKRRIDVWWWDDASSRLLLLMAYLMTRTETWEDARIRVIAAVDPEKGEAASQAHLQETMNEVRIDADVRVIETVDADTVVGQSSDATIVFLPLRLKGDQPLDPFGGRIEDLVSRLPVTALAIAGEEIDLTAEPDEGQEGALALLLDQAEEMERRAKEAESDAVKAAETAEATMERLWKGASQGVVDELERLRKEADEARATAMDTARRAAKARAIADAAVREIPEKHRNHANHDKPDA